MDPNADLVFQLLEELRLREMAACCATGALLTRERTRDTVQSGSENRLAVSARMQCGSNTMRDLAPSGSNNSASKRDCIRANKPEVHGH